MTLREESLVPWRDRTGRLYESLLVDDNRTVLAHATLTRVSQAALKLRIALLTHVDREFGPTSRSRVIDLGSLLVRRCVAIRSIIAFVRGAFVGHLREGKMLL